MRGGKNSSCDSFKINSLSCNEIRSQAIHRFPGKHQDSESKGSKDSSKSFVASNSVDYDVTTDAMNRVYSSANKSDNIDPWWANLHTD